MKTRTRDMKPHNNRNFTHLGLFEGIGGFSYAAQQMGWNAMAIEEYENQNS